MAKRTPVPRVGVRERTRRMYLISRRSYWWASSKPLHLGVSFCSLGGQVVEMRGDRDYVRRRGKGRHTGIR